MIVGTAGHVNHGKTTLVHALTGVDCDRLEAEQRRGITIELGFARWDLPGGRAVSVIDVPGHARYAHTMATGALGLDLALLVVAADEGLMPQTFEHVNACAALGVHRLVVAVTRTDRVEDLSTMLDLIREELADAGLGGAPIVPVCAPRAEGLDELAEAVAGALADEPHPDRNLPLLLPVDRAFSMKGFGTVITGSLMRGVVENGQTVQLSPSGLVSRVRGLHVHGADVERAEARTRLALNLADVQPADVERGTFLSTPDGMCVGRTLDVSLSWASHHDEPLDSVRSVQYICGAARATARVTADAPIPPGGVGTGRVVLDRPVPLVGGLGFVLRGGPRGRFGAVVGGGRVLDAQPPRRRRAETRVRLAESMTPDVLIAEAGRRGVAPETVGPRLGIPPLPAGPTLFGDGVLEEATTALVASVRAFHDAHPAEPGLPLAQVADDALGRAALDAAIGDGRLQRDGSALAMPGYENPQLKADELLSQRLLETIGRTGLSGPAEVDLAKVLDAQARDVGRCLDALEKRGAVMRSGGFCFPASEVATLQARLVDALSGGVELPVSWLKDEAGLTRKHAIPLWTWFDRSGVTIRRGNVRVAGPRARATQE